MSLQTGSRPRSAGLGLVGILRFLFNALDILRTLKDHRRLLECNVILSP